MLANQAEYVRIEQRSGIKFWVTKKYKPYEVYRTIFDLHETACFSKKMFTGCRSKIRNILV